MDLQAFATPTDHVIDGQQHSHNRTDRTAAGGLPMRRACDQSFASPVVRVAVWRTTVGVVTNGSRIGAIHWGRQQIQTWN